MSADDATCPRCPGWAGRWVLTLAGRRIRIDPDPHPDGTVVRRSLDGHWRAQILTGDLLPAQEPAWRRHDCARAARLAPRCHVCSGPMHADLARLEAWTTHPACQPDHLRPLPEIEGPPPE